MRGAEGVEAVRRFCEAVSDRNIQNLELLRKIDRTVDWLSGMQKSASGDIAFAYKFVELIKASDFPQEIDPDEIISGKLEEGTKIIGRLLDGFMRKKQSALNDPALTGENEQCVVYEYDGTIATFSELSEAMNELRSAIEQHDAELEEVVGPFDSADDLIASLKA